MSSAGDRRSEFHRVGKNPRFACASAPLHFSPPLKVRSVESIGKGCNDLSTAGNPLVVECQIVSYPQRDDMTDSLQDLNISRRGFVGTAAAAVAANALPARVARTQPPERPSPVAPFTIEEKSISQLSESMRTGELTARAITQQYLDRIASLDRQGPLLRYVLETNPDALAIADTLDAERRAGRIRGPLHGIPVLVKDNIDTADRMTTTAGSLALEGTIALRDAHIAGQLRAAGAIILGKTNLSEWANFRSTHSSSGWAGRGRQARNPYALDRTPAG